MASSWPFLLIGGGVAAATLAVWMRSRGRRIGVDDTIPRVTASPAPLRLVPSLPPTTPVRVPLTTPTTDAERWASLDPTFRARVRRVFDRMEARGFQPRLYQAWRSLGVQADHVAAGRSTVSVSYHNAVDANGRPAALGADVADRRYGWGVTRQGGRDVWDPAKGGHAAAFFLALREEVRAAGLASGGDWSRRASSPWSAYDLGWDPAHIEPRGSSLAHVRAGLRDAGLIA